MLRILRNRLGFIFYVLDDEGSVYTVFEVLNSRGLEVDWLDKSKSMLMGIAFEKFKGREQHLNIIKSCIIYGVVFTDCWAQDKSLGKRYFVLRQH